MNEQVLNLLLSGERYTGKRLAEIICTDESTIRKIINSLRCDGVLVCSSNRGYHISNDEVEILKTIASLTCRIAQMQKAIEGLKRGVRI